MSENIKIREYRESDIEMLAHLTTELGYPTHASDMYTRMQGIKNHPDYITFIAEISGIVVGYIGLIRCLRWEESSSYIKIQALVTDAQYRRLGIGRALISHTENYARTHGIGLLMLSSGNRAERKVAHLFYPQLGFFSTSTNYKKILE